MFCYNCGAKLPDGFKFCPECGTNLAVLQNESIETKNETEQQLSTSISDNNMSLEERIAENQREEEEELEAIKRKYITEIFNEIFNDSRIFGNHVYIVGKNPLNQEIKENLEDYYLEGANEKPLLVFDYKNGLENGFVVTNRRLVWYYSSSRGRQSIELDEIYDMNVGKALLATVFRPIDVDNIQHSEIYLDGIREMDTFIVKFNKFIDEIYYTFNDSTDEGDDNEKCENTEEPTVCDLLAYACHIVKVNDTYCTVGNPTVEPSAKKYSIARRNFNIPDEDDIFLIYDSTVFGSCEKGFAICTSGIYYCQNVRGYLDWAQFSKQNITCGFTGLKLANETFSMGTDGKNISIILNTIKEHLS